MENAKICNNYNLDETIAKDYSNNVDIFATALAVATSYCSLNFKSFPKSSALPCTHTAFAISFLFKTSCKNKILLFNESNKVSFISSLTIFTGIPGNPAPVPTSMIELSLFIYFSIVKE